MTYKLIECKHKPEKEYWDYADLLYLESFNPDIAIANSPRNYGKSFAGRWACQKEIDKGECVGWGRYNKPESAKAFSTWQSFNPNLEIVKGSDGVKILVDPCTGGKVLNFQWSISQSNKDTDLPFTRLVYDEFIPERYTNKTRLDTEFDDWYSTDTSLSRSYAPKKLMIANNIYWFNPFYLQWGIPPFPKGYILKQRNRGAIERDGIGIEYDITYIVENVSATPAIIKRNIAQNALKFSSPDDLEKYYDNATKQEYTTIAECPDKTKQLANFQIMSDGYYCGFRECGDMIYWEKVKKPDWNKDTFVSEPAYIDVSKRHYRRKELSIELEGLFNNGCMAFDSAETLLCFMRWIRHLRSRI